MAFKFRNTRAARVTGEQVVEIRRRYHEVMESQGSLAREFGISIGQIGRIVRGESWQALPNASPTYVRTAEEIKAEGDRALALILKAMPLGKPVAEPDPMVDILARLSGDIGKAKAEKARVDGMLGQLTGDDNAGKKA